MSSEPKGTRPPAAPAGQPADRERGERAHRLALVVDGLLAVVKMAAGTVSRSPSLLADGFHSVADVATGLVGWLGFRWASRPADEDHHYGHGKAEAAAGFFVGLVLVVGGLGVLRDALLEEAPTYRPDAAAMALAAAGVSIATNLWMAAVMGRAARALGSHTLRAVARDKRSDSLSSILVVLGVGANLAGVGAVETVAAALIGGSIGWMGAKSIKEGLDVLMDRVPDTQLRDRLRTIARDVTGVVDVQRIDVHPLGSTVRVDMEISVDGALPVRKGHAIAHEVERVVTLAEVAVVEVAVHVNPAPGDAEGYDSPPIGAETRPR